MDKHTLSAALRGHESITKEFVIGKVIRDSVETKLITDEQAEELAERIALSWQINKVKYNAFEYRNGLTQ